MIFDAMVSPVEAVKGHALPDTYSTRGPCDGVLQVAESLTRLPLLHTSSTPRFDRRLNACGAAVTYRQGFDVLPLRVFSHPIPPPLPPAPIEPS